MWEQTAEVLANFPVDGIFFDIVRQEPCLCQNCLSRMTVERIDAGDTGALARFARRTTDEFKRDFTRRVRSLNAEKSPRCRYSIREPILLAELTLQPCMTADVKSCSVV